MKKSIFTVLLGAALIALIAGCSQQEEEVAESKIPTLPFTLGSSIKAKLSLEASIQSILSAM